MVVYGIRHEQAHTLSLPLLAWAAQLHWGLTALPPLTRTPRGKPFFPDHPEYQFNISHSGAYLVCALDSAPVGVDLQVFRPSRTAFLDRLCAPQERVWLAARQDSPLAFARLWAMKESRCKWSGQGLTRPISNISVPLPAADEPLLTLDGLHYALRTGADWAFCLCSGTAWDGEIQWLNQPQIVQISSKEAEPHDSTGM